MIVIFSRKGRAQYLHWQQADRKLAQRLNTLIEDARRSPFKGIGKPEPLGGNLAGWWSRRIDDEHRLVYRVVGKGNTQSIEIAQCRYHY